MDQNVTILIVDDEPLGRQLLEAIFFPEGYNLIFAEDGLTAVNIIKEKIPSIVLLDVMMPHMDGFEVCRQIRKNEKTAHISVFLITALDDRDSRIKGIDAGADDYISKPFDRIEILAKVKNRILLSKFQQKATSSDTVQSSAGGGPELPVLDCVIDQFLACDNLTSSINIDVFRSKKLNKSKYAFFNLPAPEGNMYVLLSNKAENIDGTLINCLLRISIGKESMNAGLMPSLLIQSTLNKVNKLATEYNLKQLADNSYSFIMVYYNQKDNHIVVSGLNQTLFVSMQNDAKGQYKPFYLMGNQDLSLTSIKDIMLFSDNIHELHSQPELINFLNSKVSNGSLMPLSSIIPQKFNQSDDILAVKLGF